jgi:hypothetical protein
MTTSIIITNTLDMLTSCIKTSCDEGSFDSYKEIILPQLDLLNPILNIYDLVEGCSRSDISNYISLSDPISVNNCLGQIETQAIAIL